MGTLTLPFLDNCVGTLAVRWRYIIIHYIQNDSGAKIKIIGISFSQTKCKDAWVPRMKDDGDLGFRFHSVSGNTETSAFRRPLQNGGEINMVSASVSGGRRSETVTLMKATDRFG